MKNTRGKTALVFNSEMPCAFPLDIKMNILDNGSFNTAMPFPFPLVFRLE